MSKKVSPIVSQAAALLIGCFAIMAVATPALADVVTFNWSLTSPASQPQGGFALTGGGTLTATTGVNGDLVTAMTGTLNGTILVGDDVPVRVSVSDLAVTNLAATGTVSGNDNLIFPIGTMFQTDGTSFTSVSNLNTANPVNSVNGGLAFLTDDGAIRILSTVTPSATLPGTGNFYEEFGPGGFGVGVFTLTEVAAVPEPSTWAMMILGFLSVGFMAYRNKTTLRMASSHPRPATETASGAVFCLAVRWHDLRRRAMGCVAFLRFEDRVRV